MFFPVKAIMYVLGKVGKINARTFPSTILSCPFPVLSFPVFSRSFLLPPWASGPQARPQRGPLRPTWISGRCGGYSQYGQ